MPIVLEATSNPEVKGWDEKEQGVHAVLCLATGTNGFSVQAATRSARAPCRRTHLLRVSLLLFSVPMKTVWNSLLARSCTCTASPSLYCPMRRASASTIASPASIARTTNCGSGNAARGTAGWQSREQVVQLSWGAVSTRAAIMDTKMQLRGCF